MALVTDSEGESDDEGDPVTFSFPIPVNFSVPTPAGAAIPPAETLFFAVPMPMTSAGAGLPAAVDPSEDVPQLLHQSGHRVAALLQTARPTAGVLQVVDLVTLLMIMVMVSKIIFDRLELRQQQQDFQVTTTWVNMPDGECTLKGDRAVGGNPDKRVILQTSTITYN